MPWQPSESGSIAQDAQGAYHVKVAGQWMAAPKGSIAKDDKGTYHFNSDAFASPTVGVPGDIDSAKQGIPEATAPDATGTANSTANAQEHGPAQDIIDMIRAAPSGIVPALKGAVSSFADPYGSAANLGQTIAHALKTPHATLTSVGAALQNATPEQVGKNVVAPLAVGGAAMGGAGMVADAADATSAAAAEAASPAGQLGLRSTASRPIATGAAGSSAGPTLDIQNQKVASKVLGADAGVPHDVPLNHTSLEAAAAKPGQLLDQASDMLPAAPLSAEAQSKVLAARGPKTITPGSPDVDNYVNATEARLTDPNAQFSGTEIRATRNLLSGEAATARNSADPAQRALAKYKQGIVGALDQHVADTMPENSAISPEMIANARETLAKNYNLRDLIGKGGDVDLQGLATDHRANPNKFTGPTRTVAQFASDHPEVTGSISDANRIAPPSLTTDLSHVNIINPRTWVQPLIGAAGRAGLRGSGAEAAAARTPVAGLGGEFDPKPLTQLSPPPGRAFEPHQPQAVTGSPQRDLFGTGANNFTASPPTGAAPPAAGPPGQMSLADLLSHGVEQGPAPGLSSGPMGTSAPSGIPFARNAAHEAGGLTLADDLGGGPFKGQPMSMSDFAGVKSQGVPEGILARSRPSSAPEFADLGRANNASGESAASLEAQSRLGQEKAAGVQPVIFGDSGTTPLLHDVTAVDRAPPKGHIILDANSGKVINGGGLKPSAVQALVNRWHASRLGEAF